MDRKNLMYILVILLVLTTIIFIAPVAYAEGTSGGTYGAKFGIIVGTIIGLYFFFKRFF